MALQPDGKLVVGSFQYLGNAIRRAVARFNTDGSLDTTFVQNRQINNPALDVQIQPDNKMLAAGSFTLIGTSSKVAIARFNTNGTIGTGFIFPDSTYPELRILLCKLTERF